MKKITKQLLPLVSLMGILILPYFVFAGTAMEGNLQETGGMAGFQQANETTAATIAGTIVNVALGFLGMIFIVLMIYGGFLWMTAQGNEDQIEKAKNIIKNSVIGLIILVSAASIYWVVSSIFRTQV